MPGINKLIKGYKNFYQHYFIENAEIYKNLSQNGQSPIATVIACSDSRVDPLLITGAEPGELFVIRNVANLVPPYQDDTTTYHGTSAALEFAVNRLQIPNLIVFGHSKCAGIRALVDYDATTTPQNFIDSWVQIARDVKMDIEAEHGHLNKDVQAHICERKAIEKSLQNLMTFPWIAEKVEAGTLRLDGWYFDIEQGELMRYNDMDYNWDKVVERDENGETVIKKLNMFAELVARQSTLVGRVKKFFRNLF